MIYYIIGKSIITIIIICLVLVGTALGAFAMGYMLDLIPEKVKIVMSSIILLLIVIMVFVSIYRGI